LQQQATTYATLQHQWMRAPHIGLYLLIKPLVLQVATHVITTCYHCSVSLYTATYYYYALCGNQSHSCRQQQQQVATCSTSFSHTLLFLLTAFVHCANCHCQPLLLLVYHPTSFSEYSLYTIVSIDVVMTALFLFVFSHATCKLGVLFVQTAMTHCDAVSTDKRQYQAQLHSGGHV
jgi:hypothetical protein